MTSRRPSTCGLSASDSFSNSRWTSV